MAKFQIDTLDDLARQLTFSPQETRAAQVNAAEELLHSLEPQKTYPLDFVVFRITGYHPKSAEAILLPGAALQHDLGQLIEKVSDSLNQRTEEIAEPVLSIEDVTETFNVTSKTIQRWRRKGLPARKFLFADGKRRVGFLLTSVERFVLAHESQVAQAANFSQVSPEERQAILARAHRLVGGCGCCEREVARRIARKLNRSPLTILHLIRKHDQEDPASAVFGQTAPEIPDAQRASILRKHQRGQGLRAIARRFGRPIGEIYRVLLDERAARLKRRKVRFIDDPLYHQPDAQAVVDAISAQEELAGSRPAEELRVPRDLPPYLQELYRTPLLTPARERALFLKFNYRKYAFVSARRKLDPELVRRRELDLLEVLLQKATEVKNQIVRANLRLVVSVARKHLRPNLSLMELVSEGNITLMRAVESFDFHKGNRFSTYATFALMKGFARTAPEMMAAARRHAGGAESLGDLADRRAGAEVDSLARRDEVRHLLSGLTAREREVLSEHFGLEGRRGGADGKQLARKLGLTRQRIRQIQQSALSKLRAAADRASN